MSIFADGGKRTGWVRAKKVAGASCTGRGEIDIDIVNRLMVPVVDEIWHEFCSCLLT
jgi:hypothetical protein